jgi:Carboxypeptidase regulatory-like domain/TonB dependent receptor/TonB-dependent Receptor Plug Domain
MLRRLVGLFTVLLLATPLYAQQGTTELRGRVLDAQGGILPGVTVTVRNQATGMYRETVSGGDGSYIASGLTPGTYEINAELQGFKKFNRRELILEVGKTTTVDVKMEVGGIEQTVTVTADSPLVDVTSKEIGGNITSETLVQLPSVNGNFIGFVGLLPGIVPSISTESFGSDSISVNGQDPRNNNYMLDGGNNNDDVIGQRAGTQARTPIEAIQEFQVITNQYDAEFGRTAGAVVNAVTKAGTNQVSGSGFGYFQRAGLTEKDFFAKEKNLAKPNTKYDRWGGTVGGPIVKDKLHYFASLERFSIDRPNTVNIPARPEFNGTQVTKDRVWNTIVRGDHQLNSNNTYSLRWLRESSPQTNQIIGAVTPAAAREESDVDQTLSANFNSVLSSTKVNTLRTTWTRENVAFANHCFNTNGRDLSKCEPTLAFQTFTDQQDNTAQARIDDAIMLDETLAWFLPGKHGDHDIKFGAQYEYTGALNLNQGNLNGTFSFGLSNGPFNPAIASTYPDRFSIRVGGENRVYEKIHYFAGFAQDKWRVNPRLTVSLGVRYDLESMPIPEIDDPLVTKAPVDKNNIAPRLGLTYDANGGKSVVRAGLGRFYEREHLELIAGLWNPLFSTSSAQTFPLSGPDLGPRNGRLPTDPFLANGPVINTALLNQLFPSGVPVQSTGPTWDNPDRSNPYTDEYTVGYEHQLAGSLAVSADYVHQKSRSMLMALNLNPNQRSNPNVNNSTLARIGSPTLTAARAQLLQKYPNLANFSGAVSQFVNTGKVDYDALMFQLKKRFSHNYSAQVSYTYGDARGNFSGSGAPGSNFQVGQDMHLELNEGPTDFDIKHNLTISGTALVPHTYGLNVSWVARALSGSPFTLTNGAVDPDLNGIQAEPLAAGSYTGAAATDNYTVKNFISERNGARAPGFFNFDMRLGYRIPLSKQRRVEIAADIFNITNHTNFATPGGNQNAPTTFLVLTAYNTSYSPRKVQIGARIQF